jgi:AmmeMemoRadiSam system protein B
VAARASLPLNVCLCILACAFSLYGAPFAVADTAPLPALFTGKDRFARAIAREQGRHVALNDVSGIAVPHHLLAIDLIAQGFALAAGRDYRRVIVLSPDHFKRARRPFAVTRRDFATPLGPVRSDRQAVAFLLAACDCIAESSLLAREHGVHALLPFIAHHFPRARVVTIALRIDSVEADWRRLIDALKPLMTADTLIVQSTDFSHYLPYHEAKARDQYTMKVIAAGDRAALAQLSQPGNLDSRAGQYVHMLLQRELFDAAPIVITNRNSQGYSTQLQRRTTSYIPQLYRRPAPRDERCVAAPRTLPQRTGEQVFFFAGDTFFGRHVAPRLQRPAAADVLRRSILEVTRGLPLIVNLEGVPLAEMPSKLSEQQLAMPRALTIDWLRSLEVRAVGIANNHALDFGSRELDSAVAALQAQGIIVLRQGEIANLGPFRLAALTDLSNTGTPSRELMTPALIDALQGNASATPLFAFVHWGREYERTATPRTRALATALSRAGVELIIGSHPHVASHGLELIGGKTLLAHSLGNFIFDQPGCARDGALLEVRFFAEGSWAARWHPIGNPLDDVDSALRPTGTPRPVHTPAPAPESAAGSAASATRAHR